jgi:hypothetical protein
VTGNGVQYKQRRAAGWVRTQSSTYIQRSVDRPGRHDHDLGTGGQRVMVGGVQQACNVQCGWSIAQEQLPSPASVAVVGRVAPARSNPWRRPTPRGNPTLKALSERLFGGIKGCASREAVKAAEWQRVAEGGREWQRVAGAVGQSVKVKGGATIYSMYRREGKGLHPSCMGLPVINKNA